MSTDAISLAVVRQDDGVASSCRTCGGHRIRVILARREARKITDRLPA